MRVMRRAAAVLFWLAFLGVALFSLLPASEMPSTGMWDKAEHALAYAVLGGLAALAGARPNWVAALAATAVGALLELGQMMVPGRSASLADLAADALGATIGVLGVMIVARLASMRSARA